jgi:hypothetical protein
LIIGLSKRSKQEELHTWLPRIGEPAVRQRHLAWELFLGGWLSGIVFVSGFIIASSQHAKAIAVIFIALAFLVSAVAMFSSAAVMSQATRLVLEHNSLPKQAAKSMKKATLRDPVAFDAWLANQHRI